MYERTYHKEVLKSDQTSIKVKKNPWKKILYIFIVLSILTLTFFVLRSPKAQIKNISVSGNVVLDTLDIQNEIFKKIEGNKLFFFPKSSYFLVSRNSLENKLKEQFSRIENISIKSDGLTTLSVDIVEYGAQYLWCVNNEDCFLMDKKGVVYSDAPFFSGSAYTTIVTDSPIEKLPFKALSDSQVSQIEHFSRDLSEINIKPLSFRLISKDKIEIDFLRNKDVSKIIVDPKIDTDTSLEYIFSALRSEPFGNMFRSSNNKLQYLDIRFSNKVIYKFDNIETTQE